MSSFNQETKQEIIDSLESARRLLANECYVAADTRIYYVLNLLKQSV